MYFVILTETLVYVGVAVNVHAANIVNVVLMLAAVLIFGVCV